MQARLRSAGCGLEVGPIPGLLAVDVPPEIDYSMIVELVSNESEDGILDYEEACISQQHGGGRGGES